MRLQAKNLPIGLKIFLLISISIITSLSVVYWISQKGLQLSLQQRWMYECSSRHNSLFNSLEHLIHDYYSITASSDEKYHANLLRKQIYRRDAFKIKNEYNFSENLIAQNLTPSDLDKLNQRKILSNAFAGISDSRVRKVSGAFVLSIAKPTLIKDGQVEEVTISEFSATRVFDLFQKSRICPSLLVQRGGAEQALIGELSSTEELSASEKKEVTEVAMNFNKSSNELPVVMDEFYIWAHHSSNNFTVITILPKKLLAEERKLLRNKTIYIAGILLALGILAAFYLQLPLIEAIHDISTTLKKIAHGNFKAQVRLHRKDEIGKLEADISDLGSTIRTLELRNVTFHKLLPLKLSADILEHESLQMGHSKTITAVKIQFDSELLHQKHNLLDVLFMIIHRNHGWVDQFNEHEILAIWGTPKVSDRQAADATMAAVECLQTIQEIQKQSKASAQIEVNEGQSILLGASERQEYTIRGAVLNELKKIPVIENEITVTHHVASQIHPFFQIKQMEESDKGLFYQVITYHKN